jgi:hypothetical protein
VALGDITYFSIELAAAMDIGKWYDVKSTDSIPNIKVNCERALIIYLLKHKNPYSANHIYVITTYRRYNTDNIFSKHRNI